MEEVRGETAFNDDRGEMEGSLQCTIKLVERGHLLSLILLKAYLVKSCPDVSDHFFSINGGSIREAELRGYVQYNQHIRKDRERGGRWSGVGKT